MNSSVIKSKRVIYFIFFLVFASSCKEPLIDNCLEGSGRITSESRVLPNFHSVIIKGSGDISLTQADSLTFLMQADDNIIPIMLTTVNNEVLTIEPEKSICPTQLDFYITMPELRKFRFDGSGNIYSSGQINAAALSFEINGSSNIDCNSITATMLSVNIEGSGDIKIAGAGDNADALIEGSGNINFGGFQAKIASARIDGSGNITVWATEKATATINGSGNIYVKGDPPVLETHISGSGQIIKI